MGEYKPHKKYGGLKDMFNMYYCPECGKDFVVQDTNDYQYHKHDGKKNQYFCSWKCYRAFCKRYEEEKLLKRQVRYNKVKAKNKEEKDGVE